MRFDNIDLDYCAVKLSSAFKFSGGGYVVKNVFDGSGTSDTEVTVKQHYKRQTYRRFNA